MRTSILTTLTAPLCDLLLEPAPDQASLTHGSAPASRSQALLEHLESGNLFVRALDAGKEWYRYHPLFGDLLRRREEDGDSWTRLPILVNLALTSSANRRGTDALKRALSLARPVGSVRAFLEAGDPIVPLLRHAASQGIVPEFATELLEHFQSVAHQDPVAAVSAPLPVALPARSLVQPLTEREFEVLQFLATSLPAEEIAAQLFVAVSTVRSHTKSIYAKLHVHRRIDAIKRAQELKLIQKI